MKIKHLPSRQKRKLVLPLQFCINLPLMAINTFYVKTINMKKLRKWLNHLLHDKDAFHKDANLRTKVELLNYFLDHVIELEKQVVPEKIKYFWYNKKIFLARLFAKALFILSIVGGILFVAWFFGFRYTPSMEKKPRYVVLYVTETTDTNYVKSRLPMARFVLIYPPDPHKDWEAFKEAIHFKFETAGLSDSVAYKTRRMTKNKEGKMVPSQYWGKYQMGQGARSSCGIGTISWEEFSTNPELQEAAFKTWIRILYRDMTHYINQYSGRTMAGHQLTASGIISMAHNVGETATLQFLTTNGGIIPMDGDDINIPKKPATRFLTLGGYNLSSILQ